MTESSKSEDQNLEGIMIRLGNSPPRQIVESEKVSPPAITIERTNQALTFLNQYWNVSRLDLTSRRKSFAWLFTIYKRFLALLLRPYINVILFKQAEFNEQMARYGNTLWDKTNRLGEALNQLQRLGEQLRVDCDGLKQLGERLQQLKDDLRASEESLKEMFRHELENSSREEMERKINAAIEHTLGEQEKRIELVREEVREAVDSIQHKLNQNMSALTRTLLESVGDVEEDELSEAKEEDISR
jgi:hypothetical protein